MDTGRDGLPVVPDGDDDVEVWIAGAAACGQMAVAWRDTEFRALESPTGATQSPTPESPKG